MTHPDPQREPPRDLSAGPYKKGEGRVVFVGLLPATEYFPEGKYAVVEFPAGPPKLAYAVVWEGTPVAITLSSDHAELVALLREAEVYCPRDAAHPVLLGNRISAALAKHSEGLPEPSARDEVSRP